MGVSSTIGTRTARSAERLAADAAGHRAQARILALPLGLALVAMLIVLWATPGGLGLTSDSTQYLSASHYLRSGEGLRVHWWEEGTEPLTHFPPGHVIAIATLESAGLTPDASARLVNSAALAAIALLAFGLARRAGNGSTAVGMGGAAAVVLARDVLAANAMIWTEPLYLALMLGALLATARALERDSMSAVALAAVLAGMAGLVRYVAPALIGAIALSLLLLGPATRGRRVLRAVVFVVLAAVPTALLYAFNASQGAHAADRQLVFHPPAVETLLSAVRTAYYWFLPLNAPNWLEFLVFVALGIALATLAVSLYRSWGATSRPTAGARDTRLMLAIVVVGYLSFLYAALTLVDAQSTPDNRMLLPVVPPLAILIVAALSDLLRVPATRRPAMVMAAALSLGAITSLATWVVLTRQNGLGYNAAWWRTSELMATIRQLGPETTVFTNRPGAILYLTGREVPGIPRLANPNSLRPNVNYASQMAAICDRAANRRIVYAYFTDGMTDWFLPSLREVRLRWHSRPSLVTPEGILDTVPATCGRAGAN